MDEARRQSTTSAPEELDDEKKDELNKSDKLLDKVAAHSSFMNIFSK